MRTKPYDKVSSVYEKLMRTVDYKSWAKYILMLAEENVNRDSHILELGSGNCKMAKIISKKYNNYFATDISLPMLQTSGKDEFSKVCCSMTALPFKTKFDFIFSAFDCVNYILKKKYLLNLFQEVNHLLQDDGIFTFDVSLEENSLNFVISKTTEGRHNGNWYKLISKYNKRNRIHSNNFYIWNKAGEKYRELHKEKIYEMNTYFRLAEKAGLHTIACYDCFDFVDVSNKSKRAQFLMRKIN